MLFRRGRGDTSTYSISVRGDDHRTTFSGKIDLMKTVYPRSDTFRPSLSLSIIPEEDDMYSILSVVMPVIEDSEGEYRTRRRGPIELVIDMALIMRRKLLRIKRASE